MKSRITHALIGALGGALATAGLAVAKALEKKLPRALRLPKTRRDPGDFMVSQVEGVVGERLPGGVRQAAVLGMHAGYGVFWPAVIGGFAPRLGVHRLPRALLVGASLGAAVWAAGYVVWQPAAKLTPPVWKQGWTHVVSALAFHVMYGVVSVLPLHAFSVVTRRRGRRTVR